MSTTSPLRGVPLTILEASSTGPTETKTEIALPTSFKNHIITIKGIGESVAGSIQPEVSSDKVNWAPLGGGSIAYTDEAVEYNFSGYFPFFRVSQDDAVADGEVEVQYAGS